MDRLRDHDPAAIARIGATARGVIITLLPPPRHADLDRGQIAQDAAGDHLPQLGRNRPRAMLKDDPQRHLRRGGQIDNLAGPRQIPLDRLFQKDRKTGGHQGRNDLQTRIRRRHHQRKIQRLVSTQSAEIGVDAIAARCRRKCPGALRIASQYASQRQRLSGVDRCHMGLGHHPVTNERYPRGLSHRNRPVMLAH